MKNKYKIKAQHEEEPTQASISPYLQQLRSLASEKSYRLDEVQMKIDRSKPVFQGLLSKIRKKQQRLKESLNVEKNRANKSARLAADYAELHELGVQIIEKHGLLKKFNDPNSNYSTRHNTKAKSPSVQRFVRGMRQEHEQPVPQFRVPEPTRPDIVHPSKQPALTLYELLQQKLNRKPQVPKPKPGLSQQLSSLSKQLKIQTDKLQQMRKSLKDSKSRNTVSEKRIRPAMRQPTIQDQPTMIKKTTSVKHFIDSKRNKLQQLRNQDSLELKAL